MCWALPSPLQVVRLLLTAGAPPDTQDARGRTALHVAALKGRLGVARSLVEARAAVNLADSHGRTALYWAASGGGGRAVAPLVALLSRSGADLDSRDRFGHSALDRAVSCGEVAAVVALASAGAPVRVRDKHGSTPLHAAAQRGDAPVVTALLQADCVVEGLEELSSVADQDGQTALLLAAAHGHESVVEVLAAESSSVNRGDGSGRTPLAAAAAAGHIAAVSALVRAAAGVNLDAQDEDGCSALHLAALRGHNHVVDLLTSAGADASVRTRNGLLFTDVGKV